MSHLALFIAAFDEFHHIRSSALHIFNAFCFSFCFVTLTSHWILYPLVFFPHLVIFQISFISLSSRFPCLPSLFSESSIARGGARYHTKGFPATSRTSLSAEDWWLATGDWLSAWASFSLRKMSDRTLVSGDRGLRYHVQLNFMSRFDKQGNPKM